MAEAHRIPKETSGESGGVGVFVKCTAQGTHRCDESLCWVAEAQSDPEGESIGDTGVPSVYVVGVAGRWRIVSWSHHGKHGHHKVDREQRDLSHG